MSKNFLFDEVLPPHTAQPAVVITTRNEVAAR